MGENLRDEYAGALEGAVADTEPPCYHHTRPRFRWWFEVLVFLGCFLLSGAFLWCLSALLKWVTG